MIIHLKTKTGLNLDHDPENAKQNGQLLNQFRKTFGQKFEPIIHAESAFNIKLLLQQLENRPFPSSLKEQNLYSPYYLAHFQNRLANKKPDVIVLSIEPDLNQPLYHHKSEDFCFSPEPNWEQHWSDSQKAWLNREFEQVGLTDPNQYERDLLALVNAYRENWNSAVLILNASTIDPNDKIYTYRGLEDHLPLRINLFNLALLRVSMQAGVSIVDIDRLVAEVGAKHVIKPLQYSDEVATIINQEIVRIIADLGLAENDQSLLRLDMPYDPIVKEGTVKVWHKKIGDNVNIGEKLVDLEASFRKLQRTQSSLHLSRGKHNKAGGKIEQVLVRLTAAKSGVLREIYAHPGNQVQEGTLMAIISNNGHVRNINLHSVVLSAAKFRVDVHKLDIEAE
jgi:hypothetical protein